jgi:DNA-binding winged helix-turn-helix (wHTH) protein
LLCWFEDYVLDRERRELRRAGAVVAIEPQVFDLLEFLIRNRDRVVSKDDLLASVWGGRIVSESTLASRINAARRAIGDTGERQGLIRTIIGKGIRFVIEVHEQQIECDANSVRARVALGLLRRLQNRLDESRIEFETAIALVPNYAPAFCQLGMTLICLGQPETAIPKIEKALRLSSHDPTSPTTYSILSQAHRSDPDPLSQSGPRLLHVVLQSERRREQRLREYCAWGNARFLALREDTIYRGLRRAGMPDQ